MRMIIACNAFLARRSQFGRSLGECAESAYIGGWRVLPDTSIRSIPEAISHPRELSLRRSWPDVYGSHLTLMASEDLPANGHGGPADPATADNSVTKARLRRELRAARTAYVATLDPGERATLMAALANILAQHLPPGAVAAYCAVGAEIDPSGLDRPLALPRSVRGQPLTFHAVRRSDCRPAAFGIHEPAADAPAVIPDIVLVPLLAVDSRGTRLGYGGGFYDRTLAALRAKRRVLAVGVAWDMQRVAALPADPWDERLDALATPSGWHDFTR